MMNRTEKFKSAFKVADLAVYIGLPLFFAALILIFVFMPSSSSGLVYCDVNGEHVFSYEFASENLTILDKSKAAASTDGDLIVIMVSPNDHYNEIVISKSEKTIRVKDADCVDKSCTFMRPLRSGENGVIICAPHALRIYFSDNDNIIMG